MKANYHYGSLAPFIDLSALDWSEGIPDLVPAERRLEVEIGFGTGEYLAGLSAADPETAFIGFEQCPKRIIKSLRKLHENQLANAFLLRCDASWAFAYLLKPQSVAKVHCLFPCPWPKKKHIKHRLFQPSFLRLVHSRLYDKGVLRIVTDFHLYADWIEEQISESGFSISRKMIGAVHGTKFEKKWQAGGQAVFSELVLCADRAWPAGEKKVEPLKAFFLDHCNPAALLLTDEKGRVTISFAEKIFDAEARTAMIHAVVSEDNRLQHVWVMIHHTAKGWCVSAAPGTAILPTDGVRRAVALVYEAAQCS